MSSWLVHPQSPLSRANSISSALAVCLSGVYEASNLPNASKNRITHWDSTNAKQYNYIRENHGFKNIVYANRLAVNHNPDLPCH